MSSHEMRIFSHADEIQFLLYICNNIYDYIK
jgi:hypothetical protein